MADWTFTFEIKILIAQHISITCFIWNLSADNFKKILDLDGWKREPASRSGDTGQQVPCFDSCQLITTLMCNMCTISVFLCYQTSQKVHVRLNIGFHVVRTDGRKDGRCTVTWLPNFLGWIDFLSYGAPLARASGAWSSVKKPCYLHIALSNLNIVDSSESSLRIILLSTLVYPYEQDTMK